MPQKQKNLISPSQVHAAIAIVQRCCLCDATPLVVRYAAKPEGYPAAFTRRLQKESAQSVTRARAS